MSAGARTSSFAVRELLLFHGRMPPDAMRQSFPRLVSRFPQE